MVSLADLESHLWGATDILRDPVDAADFKTYSFPLLFFEPVGDVWDGEYQQIGDETGGEPLAWFSELHRLQIPEHCHWNDVCTSAPNLGAALLRAMLEIAKFDLDKPYGMFGDAQWSKKQKFSAGLRNDLIEHLSRLPLGIQGETSYPRDHVE